MTTRAETGADVRPSRKRVAASVRLQICANVFARSRIHFDASRWMPACLAANDVATALTHARAGAEDDARQPATPQGRGDEFTIH